ncbi:hypothetical protein [Streptomyces sp. 1331.2]|uniref:hypothetical protein n=1 Tax=Streptomyces sp. 1331.2 TaxID=1938835 RepID=UPI000BCA09E6|nr:hypothetical protein [Streptomyces sp. 1331.2]SOB82730.1 hypothetical protein SAMN06272789_2905 [Streptomyces sp. 1331.2]
MTDEDSRPLPDRPDRPDRADAPAGSTRQRTLDLIALVTLLVIATGVYLTAGSGGFSVITGAGVGLYGLWRARR